MAILIRERNVISLRTAQILDDDDNLVEFRLHPADHESLMPKGRNWWAPKDFDSISKDSAWLYRHLRSPSEEQRLGDAFPRVIENHLRPLTFKGSPGFKLLWAESGHSVAAYLEGEPWAFIDETTHEGYSKGILVPKESYLAPPGKLWDQQLFERIFPGALAA